MDVVESLKLENVNVYCSGIYLCMEGFVFFIKVELNLYCSWGVIVIGMINLLEVKLVREVEIVYVILVLFIDYDCWYEEYDSVIVEMVVNNLNKNVVNV